MAKCQKFLKIIFQGFPRPALAIDSLEWGWKKHPVVRIDMNSGDYANDGIAALRAALSRQLKGAAEKHGVVIDEMDDANRFASQEELEACFEPEIAAVLEATGRSREAYMEELRKYDIESMRAMPLLYQTGYLTIVDYDGERDRYTLDYPNEEVRASFALSLLEQYMQATLKTTTRP